MERMVNKWMQGMSAVGILLSSFFILNLFVSCESIDCTLNNVVACHYAFYSAETGEAYTLTDVLTVTAEGTEEVLYNQGTNTQSISLPMSYWQDTDVLKFSFYNTETETTEEATLQVSKTNTQHFESPDCPATMFHQLTSITFDSPTGYIESVEITKKSVQYNSQENVKIYLHTAD